MAEVLPTVSTPFTLLLTLGSDVFLQQALAIWGLVLIWVLVPAATMVWLMGYSRPLHPQPGIWTHH
ncbi:MAG: hypothetical protein AAGA01_09190 [Cyanobacteria bacterium P01_E01_bin.43]